MGTVDPESFDTLHRCRHRHNLSSIIIDYHQLCMKIKETYHWSWFIWNIQSFAVNTMWSQCDLNWTALPMPLRCPLSLPGSPRRPEVRIFFLQTIIEMIVGAWMDTTGAVVSHPQSKLSVQHDKCSISIIKCLSLTSSSPTQWKFLPKNIAVSMYLWIYKFAGWKNPQII